MVYDPKAKTAIQKEHEQQLWADVSQQKLKKTESLLTIKSRILPNEWNPEMGADPASKATIQRTQTRKF